MEETQLGVLLIARCWRGAYQSRLGEDLEAATTFGCAAGALNCTYLGGCHLGVQIWWGVWGNIRSWVFWITDYLVCPILQRHSEPFHIMTKFYVHSVLFFVFTHPCTLLLAADGLPFFSVQTSRILIFAYLLWLKVVYYNLICICTYIYHILYIVYLYAQRTFSEPFGTWYLHFKQNHQRLLGYSFKRGETPISRARDSVKRGRRPWFCSNLSTYWRWVILRSTRWLQFFRHLSHSWVRVWSDCHGFNLNDHVGEAVGKYLRSYSKV